MKRSGSEESPARRRKNRATKKLPKANITIEPDSTEEDEEEIEVDDEEIDVSSSDEIGPSSVQKYVEQLSLGLGLVSTPKSSKKKKRKDSDTSSEEERWLDAIQSGKLEEVDEELRKVKSKDPKLMTARQRAMLERKSDRDAYGEPASAEAPSAAVEAVPTIPVEVAEPLMALPSGYKQTVMTEEAIQRKALKSQKRKEKADEKREKDMKKTMERLLKKQDAKTLKCGAKKGARRSGPCITYVDNKEGPRIILPPGVPYIVEQKKNSAPPTSISCQAPGCNRPKRYSCKKTGVPLCSLECYQRNLTQRA